MRAPSHHPGSPAVRDADVRGKSAETRLRRYDRLPPIGARIAVQTRAAQPERAGGTRAADDRDLPAIENIPAGKTMPFLGQLRPMMCSIEPPQNAQPMLRGEIQIDEGRDHVVILPARGRIDNRSARRFQARKKKYAFSAPPPNAALSPASATRCRPRRRPIQACECKSPRHGWSGAAWSGQTNRLASAHAE